MNNGGTMLVFIVRKYIQAYQRDDLESAKCPLPNITDILKGTGYILYKYTDDTLSFADGIRVF